MTIFYPPRGMSRDEAARYIGVGTTKFDQMVKDGRMPKPKRVDGRTLWDRIKLDEAFTRLPDENMIEAIFNGNSE
ncbi:hypothetical protein G6L16_018650 [Agrobacterium tumefaciens]|uniref:helix-turn-helix transcriptional regulator n=1 Tax=Agrobacterium tumefaciens TaxID=358 RepID=UPI0015730FD2|nr:hypothetical protein [Agrobacterium tumefaciens]NSZ65163.1 hypothetical protein [Agrobacterium tumefaciens]NTA71534.1 hypothetical protein [Agrobacterium tumefaciens]WIE40236.1 hypothetical protein G6L16_018650 [Agrobacterium tumefaciens]